MAHQSTYDSFYEALGVDVAIVESIKQHANSGSTLRGALKLVVSQNDVSDHDRHRLLFAVEVMDICIDKPGLDQCEAFLKDERVKNLGDIAVEYYCPGRELPDFQSIRHQLLCRVPTAVLRAIVKDGVLDLEVSIHDSLSCLLDMAVKEQYDVRSSPLGKLLAGPEYQKELSKLPPEEAHVVRTLLEAMYRLLPVVADAEDTKPLIDADFTSAHLIASIAEKGFIEQLAGSDLSEEKVRKVHAEATRIDRRNDALWADIIRQRKEIPLLAMKGLDTSNPPPPPEWVEANLTTLFNDMDSITADSSTSVLGPASYLVDLLQMLKNVLIQGSPVEGAKNALDILLHRRPDIAKIELSKANVEDPVTFLELTIEIMEEYVKSQNSPGPEDPDMYEDVSRVLTPMAIFPYNNAISVNREILQARGYSRHELLRRFHSDRGLVQREFPEIPTTSPGHIATAQSTHGRRWAAEFLGLQPADFRAVTQEAFHTPQFFRLLQDKRSDLAAQAYDQAVGISTAGEYWGYESDDPQSTPNPLTADHKMTTLESGESLMMVRDELLVRSGLSASQLNAVLKTRYIGKRLVLTMRKGEEFSDHLGDMRLRSSPLVKNNSPDILPTEVCRDLQAFIRLRYRLGWSTETLDAAIAALARRSMEADDGYPRIIMDGSFIERLAAAQEVSALMEIPLLELLPFWGPMDAQVPASLYGTLFLRGGFASQYPFLALKDDGGTKDDATFGKNMTAMLHALSITQADLLALMQVLEFDENTPWTFENIAQLYSHHRLHKYIGLPKELYPEWWRLTKDLANPFLDPQSTLTALRPWLDLPDGLASIETALNMLAPDDANDQVNMLDLITVSQIIQGLADVESQYRPFLDGAAEETEVAQLYTSEALLDFCSRLLDPTVARSVVQFVEGGSSWDESTVRIFKQHFHLDESDVKGFRTPLEEIESLAVEREVINRREKAVRSIVPELRRQAMDLAIYNSLAIRFSDADPKLLQFFLNMVAPKTIGATHTYLEHLKMMWNVLKVAVRDEISNDSYFFPPATANYTFITSHESGCLIIDNQVASFLGNESVRATTPQSMRQGQAYLMSFANGLTLQDLKYSTSKGEEQFANNLVCPRGLAERCSLILAHINRSIAVANTFELDIMEIDFHHGHGVILSNLHLGHMVHLQSFVRVRQLFKTTGTCLVEFSRYLDLRSGSLGGILHGNEDEAMNKLIEETHKMTKIAKNDILEFLDQESPKSSAGERAKMLLDLSSLQKLYDCWEMANRLAVPMATLYNWAELPSISDKPEDFGFTEQLQMALSSGTAVNALARAKEALSVKKQQVLYEYLIRMPSFTSRGLTKVDDLTAEFLTDLQMGPGVKTTRISQAISTVQIFVQRSLLGQEKAWGIPTTGIDQARWKWTSKFSLWQANRKVFLYPENWIDPSLRDSKTQAFEEFESKVMKTNLNKEIISQLLRDYIYTAHEVADLDVQSYLWEATQQYRGNYHFFARTRTAPFTFYYRRISVIGSSPASFYWDWLPWTKLEVEIPTHVVEVDNKPLKKPGSYLLPAMFTNRLFLFIPQFTRLTEVPQLPADKSMEEMGVAKDGVKEPVHYWEIKMAWSEMRDGKWCPKSLTEIGLEVRAADKSPLPSISAFRFRLEKHGTNLIIRVDLLKKVGSAYRFDNLGYFEMQGPRLRLVNKTEDITSSTIESPLVFSRMSMKYDKAETDIAKLREKVEKYTLGILGTQSKLLAIPTPESLKEDYDLTWLLAFDNSQFNGASGLVVDQSTENQLYQFFGKPDTDKDGNIDPKKQSTVALRPLTHDISLLLVQDIAAKSGYECIFDTLEGIPQDQAKVEFGGEGKLFFELSSPSSLYNWELGFHAIALLVERLMATQQFELALELSRQVFDPSRDDDSESPTFLSTDSLPEPASTPLSRLDRCWRFIPFKSSTLRLAGSVRDVIQRLDPLSESGGNETKIDEWEANPFSPHIVARRRPAVYMKRFVMKCIELLIASGDKYFRQGTQEAIPTALQYYTEASALFGPAPVTIDPPTKPITGTYQTIEDFINRFSSASIDMELEFPYFVDIKSGGLDKTYDGTLGFVRSTYFGVPANPQMQTLRDLIDNRLYNIRNGLDIDGNLRIMPLYDPPMDPGQLLGGQGNTLGASSLMEAPQGPMPLYRARYLLEKALALCSELQSYSDTFISIKERRDAEVMSNLLARQGTNILSLMTETKQYQIEEATMAIESLKETRKGLETQLKYYLALVGESTDNLPNEEDDWIDLEQDIREPTMDGLRMSPEEDMEMRDAEKAVDLLKDARSTEELAEILKVFPKIATEIEPFGVGATIQTDTHIVAEALLVRSNIVKADAQKFVDSAERASRQGQLIRQLQERRMAANVAGREIKTIDKQIAAQLKTVDVAQSELAVHEQRIRDSIEAEAYLRTKYSSEELYSWLEAESRKMGYRSYLATLEMAKTCERVSSFEFGPRAKSFISNAYWDETRDGLFAAQQLAADLRRVEVFYLQNYPHDHELTKTVSLRQVLPLTLLELRSKGTVDFELPEIMFDQEFPGHYCRRIKSISLYVFGSNKNTELDASCNLQLLEHRYRLKGGKSPSGKYFEYDVSNDDRFHSDQIPISALAYTTGSSNSGRFELYFSSDTYHPFEGAGAISKWRLEFPSPYPLIDYSAITDVRIKVHYTALDGGGFWKKQAFDAVKEFRGKFDETTSTGGAYILVDLLADLPEEWETFKKAIITGSNETSPLETTQSDHTAEDVHSAKSKQEEKTITMDLKRLPEFLPAWSPSRLIKVQRVHAAIRPAEGGWQSGRTMTLLGSNLAEEGTSEVKMMSTPLGEILDKEMNENTLRLIVDSEVFQNKVPVSFWVVIQYTRPEKDGRGF